MKLYTIIRKWFLTSVLTLIIPSLITAFPPYQNIHESDEIRPKDGSLMAGDPEKEYKSEKNMVLNCGANKSAIKEPGSYFSGTISYERHVHWKDVSDLSYGKMITTVDLDESFSIQVSAGYLRDSYGSQLYKASPLPGKSAVSMTKTVLITENDGDWNKTVDTWKGEGSLKPEDDSSLLLTVNTRNKTYTLSAVIYCPVIKGTTEMTDSRGSKMTMEAESWRLSASFDMEGTTDGRSVKGSWSKPADGNLAVSPVSGLIPGTIWNWSLSRKKQ